MNRTKNHVTKNNILKTVKDVKFVIAARITRFLDPVSFFYAPTDRYYLSDSDITGLIGTFIPGHVDETGWGELIVDHHEDGHRIYASVSSDRVESIYCDRTGIDESYWRRHHCDWTEAYHEVAHFLQHTYVDGWTDRLLRIQEPEIKYSARFQKMRR